MFQQNCIIAKGIVGLDPDIVDYNDKKVVANWLKKHPAMKQLSEETIVKFRGQAQKAREAIGKEGNAF